MSDEPLHEVLANLPETSLTTRLLGALDYIVPGEWTNIRNYEEMIKAVTGEEDQEIIQKVGDRAIQLYNDPEQGYQRAVQIFRLIDDAGGIAGAASLANKLGESYDFLSFLSSVTPKADTTQAIDAGVKFVGELAAFCYTNGIPGDSVGDFASALVSYEKEDAIRFSAWVVCDLVLPLGPDFFSKVMDGLSSLTSDQLGEHSRFARIAHLLPGGDDVDAKRQLILTNLDGSRSHVESFVSNKGIEQADVFQRIKGYIDMADNTLDYVSAALDLGTSYFEHTGIQTVTRRIVSRAYGEI
jgi:hypothetical protein